MLNYTLFWNSNLVYWDYSLGSDLYINYNDWNYIWTVDVYCSLNTINSAVPILIAIYIIVSCCDDMCLFRVSDV